MLTFQCGRCSTALKTPPEHAGKIVSCPKCQTKLRVPEIATAAAVDADGNDAARPAPGAPPGRPPVTSPTQRGLGTGARPIGGRRYGFNCQYCSSRLETTEAQAGQEGSCPTCGNAIIIPILDRYGRLIDPMTGKVIKQDPHPVHAYAAAGERAPRIIRTEQGKQSIQCPKCKAVSPITTNNCKSCGMPFTMEGTTADAVGGTSNGYAVASLVLGIIGLPTCFTGIVPILALIFGIIGYMQTGPGGSTSGRGLAIAGIACSSVSLIAGGAWYLNIF